MKKASSDLLLLDVNVLLALAWPNHPFHERATTKMEASKHQQWATCALTQLGFIRISSNPVAIPTAVRPTEAAELLRSFTEDPAHVYLESLPPPAELGTQFARILGHQQVTDSYLLALADLNNARLLTLDTRLRSFSSAEVL